MNWSAPVPFSRDHVVQDFNCGIQALDQWLKTRAAGAEGRSARSYVICGDGPRVIGYYCLSAYWVSNDSLPKRLGRNMPRRSPVILLGRLAADTRHQGQGLGRILLRDAMFRSLTGSETIGARALMIEALDEKAKSFYVSLGFVSYPPDSLNLFMAFETIAAGI